MRYFKTTFIWIIILAALAGVSYIDFEKGRIEEEAKEEATRLFPFTPIEVLRIAIEKEGGRLELERWDTGWRIVAPIKARADDGAVEKFLRSVTDSRNDADYVMDPDPSPERLQEFGLHEPKVSVTLQTGRDLISHTLIFGDRAPTMGVAFARLEGEKPVYRVLASARAEANKDAYYFRHKKVVAFNPVTIDRIAINRSGGGGLRLAVPDTGKDKWVIEEPVAARADHQKVFELLGILANAEVKAFITEVDDDPASFGLAKPEAELTLWQRGAKEPVVAMKVGKRSPELRGYYCSLKGRAGVFLLEEDTVHSIPRKPSELRSRQLLFFDKERLVRIELQREGESLVITRDQEKEWRRTSGEAVPFLEMNAFLNELLAHTVRDFVDTAQGAAPAFGLDRPVATVSLWLDQSRTPLSLRLGHRAPSGNVYAKVGDDNSVVELDASIVRLMTTYF